MKVKNAVLPLKSNLRQAEVGSLILSGAIFQMNEIKKVRLAENIIFFLNIFIGVLIVTGSWFLLKTDFGQTAAIFGFFMLAISAILKLLRLW